MMELNRKKTVSLVVLSILVSQVSLVLADDDVKGDIKGAATNVGHAFRDGGKAVGHAAKKGAKAVGHAAKSAGHSITHSTKKTTPSKKAPDSKDAPTEN